MVGDRSIPPRDTHTTPRRLAAAGAALLVAILVTLAVAAAVAAPRAAAAPSLFELQKEAKRTRTEMAGLQTDLQTRGRRPDRGAGQARRGQPSA